MNINVYCVRLGKRGKYINFCKEHNVIAIGPSELGNLKKLLKLKPNEIRKKLKEKCKRMFKGWKEQKINAEVSQVFRFIYEIKPGDIVISPYNGRVLIGIVKGDYYFEIKFDACEYKHRRKVEWKIDMSKDDLPESIRKQLKSLLAVFRIKLKTSEDYEFIDSIIKQRITGKALINYLINKCTEMKPNEFEEFIANLLKVTGFKYVRKTKQTRDRGHDIEGRIVSEFFDIPVKIQVKNYKNKISRKMIAEFKGSLGINDIGIFVTTSDFTEDAKLEAKRDKVVHLINGERLSRIILKYYDKLDEKYRNKFKLKRKSMEIEDLYEVQFSRIL